MCSTTLTVREATMATTQLRRAASYEVCWPTQEPRTEFKPLRMNWVVVTDDSGNRQLRMCWGMDASHTPLTDPR